MVLHLAWARWKRHPTIFVWDGLMDSFVEILNGNVPHETNTKSFYFLSKSVKRVCVVFLKEHTFFLAKCGFIFFVFGQEGPIITDYILHWSLVFFSKWILLSAAQKPSHSPSLIFSRVHLQKHEWNRLTRHWIRRTIAFILHWRHPSCGLFI